MLRWRIALLISVAIAISYLDRNTLPSTIDDIKNQSHFSFSKQDFAILNTAFLAAYGAMYLVGGRLMDVLGTRLGFGLIMIFWSLACASHGFAAGFVTLAISRLLLGMGEGGGFPAASRAVAEWFPIKERSTAMGIINAGTGVGGVVALPLVALVIANVHWFDLNSWRWVFFLTGGLGLLWTIWWAWDYFPPERHRAMKPGELATIQSGMPARSAAEPKIPLAALFQFRETWGIVIAKFLTDAAWYFILFWLPTFLRNEHKLDLKATMSIAWIPHAAAGIGCLVGGSLSSFLLIRHFSLNSSRKIALAASAVVMPLLILVPYVSTAWVIVLMSIAYFGQQSWSTLVMVLPTDLFPKRAVGTVAGLVGLGGALGGIVLGQLSSYLLDHQMRYGPVMLIAGLLHVTGLVVILLMVRNVRPLPTAPVALRGHPLAAANFDLALKLQIPAHVLLFIGLVVVNALVSPAGYRYAIAAAGGTLVIYMVLWLMQRQGRALKACTAVSALLAAVLITCKMSIMMERPRWGQDECFAMCCVAISVAADAIVLLTALVFLFKPVTVIEPAFQEKAHI